MSWRRPSFSSKAAEFSPERFSSHCLVSLCVDGPQLHNFADDELIEIEKSPFSREEADILRYATVPASAAVGITSNH